MNGFRIIALLGLICLSSSRLAAETGSSFRFNGFDVSFTHIPKNDILQGGPLKDGIPALTKPKIIKAKTAESYPSNDLVIGLKINHETRAYPLRILIWHENVNDVVGGIPVAVTYCPLCNSVMVFDRRAGGKTLEFGVSGLLWNSNVLLYDRQKNPEKESLWSQIQMKAVTGPAAKKGLKLKLLPSTMTTWGDWKRDNPNTLVLSENTGHNRNYRQPAYKSYFTTDELYFPVTKHRAISKFKNKEPMVLVQVGNKMKAYAVSEVKKAAGKKKTIIDSVGKTKIQIRVISSANSLEVEEVSKGKTSNLAVAYLYWFSLNSVYPKIEIYQPPPVNKSSKSK